MTGTGVQDYLDGGEDGESNEPKPEKDVDLLIDDVQRQNTQTIKVLNCPRRTIFMKSAFRNLNICKVQ